MSADLVRDQACELLREIATRADWDMGIYSDELVPRYSPAARDLAANAVQRYALRAFHEGGMTWRAPLLFAIRDLEVEAGSREFQPVAPHSRECTCVGACKGASGLAPGWICALSKRAPNRCQARKHRHPKHVDDVCEGNCCTTCGGPIDEDAECRCG